MASYLNPGNEKFTKAINSEIYVDKTGLLQYTNSVLGTADAYICNSRPRRFGKSYAANMLAAYYSRGCDSREMFSELTIGRASDFSMHLNISLARYILLCLHPNYIIVMALYALSYYQVESYYQASLK